MEPTPPLGKLSAGSGGRRPRGGLRVAVMGIRGIPSAYGGAEYVADELTRHLSASGLRISVYNRRYASKDRPRRLQGRHVFYLPSWRQRHIDTLLHTGLSALHNILFDTGDVVLLFHASNGFFLPLLRAFGRRVTVHVDGLDWERKKWGPLARAVLFAGARLTARLADRIVVDNPFARQFFLDRFGRRSDEIHHGCDPPAPPPGDTLERLGLEPEGYYLFAGRFVPEKGIHYLIQAFAGLRTTRRLVVAGDDAYASDYALGLRRMAPPDVLFPGFVAGEDFKRLVKGAYAYVQPSDIEGLSPALLMAMGLARCVVASAIPENLEAIGDAGLRFPPGDVEGLRELLRTLDRDPDAVRRSGDACHRRAMGKYRWAKVAQDFRKVLEELAGDRASDRTGPVPQ